MIGKKSDIKFVSYNTRKRIFFFFFSNWKQLKSTGICITENLMAKRMETRQDRMK